MRRAARIWSSCRCPSPQYRRATSPTGLTTAGAAVAITATASPVGPAASCTRSASCTRCTRSASYTASFTRSTSGKPTCMITLRARRPRPRRVAAFVTRSPDGYEHAPVRLLAALHSQGSMQARSQPACSTRRPGRGSVSSPRICDANALPTGPYVTITSTRSSRWARRAVPRSTSRLWARYQPDTARSLAQRAAAGSGCVHARAALPARAGWPPAVPASPRAQPADVCRRVLRRSAQSWQHLAGQCRPLARR